jgi:hypothetical protein
LLTPAPSGVRKDSLVKHTNDRTISLKRMSYSQNKNVLQHQTSCE